MRGMDDGVDGANGEPAGLGVALGGGMARGAAHVGVLHALADAGLPPARYAGTSYGAIIAALAALGASPAELRRVVTRETAATLWRDAADVGLHRGALVHGDRLARWFDRTLFHGARIEDAAAPLAIAATDLATGALRVVTRGSVADAVRASCALPGLFAPAAVAGERWVDGGFAEPVPFAALRALGPGASLGVHAGVDLAGAGTLGRLRRLDGGGIGRALHRAADRVRGRNGASAALKGASLALRSYRHDAVAPRGATLLTVAPPIAWWDFHRADTAIEAGVAAVAAWRAGAPRATDDAARALPAALAGRLEGGGA